MQNGIITGINEGEAIITVTNLNNEKRECKVIVKDILYLYNNGDTCESNTSGWEYIGGRYYPSSYAKLQEDHIELYYGGYIATYLKNININEYRYVNIEMEGTNLRNYYTAFNLKFLDEAKKHTNDYGMPNSTKHVLIMDHGDYRTFAKKIFSVNIEDLKETTKVIDIEACEGRDYKVYNVSLSIEKLEN